MQQPYQQNQQFNSLPQTSPHQRLNLKLTDSLRKNGALVFGLGSLIVLLCLFFVPLYTEITRSNSTPVAAIDMLSNTTNSIVCMIAFGVLFVLCIISLFVALSGLRYYVSNVNHFVRSMQRLTMVNTCFTALHVLGGIACCIFLKAQNDTTTYEIGSIWPFILTIIFAVIVAFLHKDTRVLSDNKKRSSMFCRTEFFIYGALVCIVTIISCLSDIVTVEFAKSSGLAAVKLNGLDLLKNHVGKNAGLQTVAFALFFILTITIILLIASLITYINKSKHFYKITLYSLILSGAFSMIIGMFGKYYEIVQHTSEDGVLEWLDSLAGIQNIRSAFTISSISFYFFLAVVAIILIVLIRKPYTRGIIMEKEEDLAKNETSQNKFSPFSAPTEEPKKDAETVTSVVTVADPCPAFTELDNKKNQFEIELASIKPTAPNNPTLQGLVQHIVTYARDSRLHLSYTPEDIATFIAGLGATKLTILQGMSGTGKTSLPKIFSEAIYGNCDIIEIESSWRDKNELLGYYNEFSHIYTPKKFTQALYKAKMNPERVTFIVLDEMNLSRIEYYFSDFLSLMEHEPHKREIKLLNVSLCRNENGKRIPYQALTDGHTVKIPPNIWFIGTANRDESTFEISDKVYDRAHTMNFNKRAPKVISYNDPIPAQYISAGQLIILLEQAKQNSIIDIGNDPLIKEVEDLLAPYNISFGNRIANQMEAFISIYCACFAPSEQVKHDALEKILLSKVVSKLEFKSIDNKEQLAAEFKKRKLLRCSEFILSLNED